MNKDLKAILLHTLEFIIVFGGGFALMKLLNLGTEQSQLIISTILSAFAKTLRQVDTIPVNDYVNK